MRIAISHDTTYRYATPARSVIQTLADDAAQP